MELKSAQADLRNAYVRGGPGAIVSGLVWLAAGVVASRSGLQTGFVVLFFGGMLIYPLSLLVSRGLLRRSAEQKGNPGGPLVMETVPFMIGGLLAAWLILPHRPEFVFPLAAIAVGAHYFPFRTAYGDRTYWVLAALMCAVGITVIFMGTPPSSQVPMVIAVIEVVFGAWFTFKGLKAGTE